MTQRLIGAIEAGGTKFVVAVADTGGHVRERARIATAHPDETLLQVRSFFEQGAAAHGPLAAIGIASFGPVEVNPASPRYGTFFATPKPGWSGVSLCDALSGFGVPLAVDTDVNGAAIGEWLAGSGRGCGTLAYTTVGTGIGTGIVRGGQPLGGFSHYECGHILPRRDMARDPFAGSCPFHGDCLEGLASGSAIQARWGRTLDRMADNPEGTGLIAMYLAQLAATLVLTHMPDRLVFGGGVMKAPGLLSALRQETERLIGGYIRDERLAPGLESFVVAPGLGDDSGITGAIELGRRILAIA